VHNLKAMKKLILLFSICSFLNFSAKGQEYNDLIVKESDDTIKCKITLVNNMNIFYLYKPKRIELSKFIPLTQVKLYTRNGITIKQPFNIQSIMPVSEVEKILAEKRQISKKYTISAGNHLIRARDNMIGGIVTSFVGGTLGIVLISQDPTIGSIIAGGSVLVGFIMQIIGIIHIGDAGIKLNEQNTTALYLQPVNNGFGLTYHF